MSRRRGLLLGSVVLIIVCAAIIIAAHMRTPIPPVVRGFEVTFLDVGQGDCAFIRTPGGHVALVDGGSEGSAEIGYTTIEPFLRRRGVNRIDVLVLTHPHADHLSGLVAVMRDFRIGMVLDPAIAHPSKGYQEFLWTVRDRHIPYHRAVRGQVVDFGDGARAEVLHPGPERLTGTDDDVNNNAIVMRVTCGESTIMLTGDAGRPAEEDILSTRAELRSDVLKVAHHGSNDASSDAWLDAVQPKIAVISVGRGNSFGHPHRETLERLAAHGIRVYRTDRDGAVSITFTGGKPSVRTSIPSQN